MYLKKASFLKSIIAAVLLLAITPSARAANFADYFPLTLGSWWQGVTFVPDATQDDVMQPVEFGESRIFESLVYDGQNAFKFGDSTDYIIVSKSGGTVTIHADFEDEVLYNHPDRTIGEIRDGQIVQTESNPFLIRECSRIPSDRWPRIRLAQYEGLVDAYLQIPGLIMSVDFSSWSQPNVLNPIVLYGLSAEITSQISTGVSSIQFWAPGIGQVLDIDMDGETGDIEDLGVLTDYYIAPAASPPGAIQGWVKDAVTAQAVTGAQIIFRPGEFGLTSGSSGAFSSDSIPTGGYTVTVSAPGYQPRVLPGISIQPGSTHILNVVLDLKAASITGFSAEGFNDGITPVLLTAQVDRPEGAAALASVTVDLAVFDKKASQPLYDDGTNGDGKAGDGIYSFETTVPLLAPARTYSLNVTAIDQLGHRRFGAIALNVTERAQGSAGPGRTDTKTFSNAFAGQTLLIHYSFGSRVQAASSKALRNACTVTLTVYDPNGVVYNTYEVEDSLDIPIPNATAGTWTYETQSNCPSEVSYQIQTKGSGTGILAGRVLDGITGKGVVGAQINCNTGGATQSLEEGYYTAVVVAGSDAAVRTVKSGYMENYKARVFIAAGETTPLNIQVVPENAQAEAVPQGQSVYQVLDPSGDPSPPSQPFAATVSGGNLLFKILFPAYQQAVDLYLAMTVDYPGLTGKLFLVHSDNTIVEFAGTLHAWRQGVTAAQTGEIPVPAFTSGFPMAPYTLYALVTPDSSTFASYELSYLTTTLAQAPPGGQNTRFVSNPSNDPHPITQPLASKVSGDDLVLSAHFPIQQAPVTLFLACLTPEGDLYLVKSDNTLEKYSGTLWPWRENTKAEHALPLISLPMAQVTIGTYTFLSLATTDTTTLSNYDLIYFTHEVK
jgi:hypothetical protein